MRRFNDHGQYNMLYFNYLTRFLPDTMYMSKNELFGQALYSHDLRH